MANIAGYIANLGKSVGYAAVDRVAKMTPTTSEFMQTNSELFKEVTSSIRNFRTTYTRSWQSFKKSKIYEAGEIGYNALLEDIRTGKLYNKDRIAKIEAKVTGFGEDDMSADGGFDDSTFDMGADDDFGSFDDSDITGGDAFVSDTINKSSRSNAEMISNTVARSANYIADTQKTSSSILYSQNVQAYTLFNTNLAKINDNISNVLKFSTSTLQSHAENSKKYFEESTKLMQDQTALLRRIADSLNPKQEEVKKKEKISYDDITSASGTPDLKMYMQSIKKNMTNELGMFASMGDMFGEDSNILATFAASPLMFIPNMIVNSMVPKSIDKAAAQFDRSLQGFFGSLIARFNSFKKSDSPIWSAIGRIFGINNSAKDSIDTTNYNKGKVDWDGKSRKALVEVIPLQLSKIISILSGKGEMVFDYDQSKFVSANDIKKKYEDTKNSYVKNSSSDVRDKMEEIMKKLTFNNIEDMKSLREDMDKMFKAIYANGGFFDVNSKTLEDDYLDYGVDSKNFRIFRSMFRSLDRGTQLSLGSSVVSQRAKQNKYFEDLEKSGDSIFQYLFNNFNPDEFIKRNKETGEITDNESVLAKTSIVKALDDKGNNIFFYLQNIYKELMFIRQSGGIGGGSNYMPEVVGADGSRYTMPGLNIKDITIADKSGAKQATEERKRRERESAKFIEEQKKLREKDKSLINVSEFTDEKRLDNAISAKVKVDNLTEELKEKREQKKSLLDKLIESKNLTDKTKTVVEKLNEVTSKPMKFIVNTINKVDQRLYEVIFGNADYKGKKVNGIFGIIKLELQSAFTKLNSWLDEKVLEPLRQKFQVDSMKDLGKKFLGWFGIDDDFRKRIHDYFFGKENGLFTSTINATKGVFKNAFSVMKQSMKDAYGPLWNRIKEATKSSKDKNLEKAFDDQEDQEEAGEQSTLFRGMMNNARTVNINSLINKAVGIKQAPTQVEHDKAQSEYEALFGMNNLANMNANNKRRAIQDFIYNVDNDTNPIRAAANSKKYKSYMQVIKGMDEKDEKVKVQNQVSSYLKGMNGLIDFKDQEKTLLEKLFQQSVTDSTSGSKLKFGVILNLVNELAKKDWKYRALANKLNDYSTLFSDPKDLTVQGIIDNNRRKVEEQRMSTEEYVNNHSAFAGPEGARLEMQAATIESSRLLTNISNTVSSILELMSNSMKPKSSVQGPSLPPTSLDKALLANEEGKATFGFAQDLTNTIANWMYRNMSHYDQGGEVEKPKVATLGKGEVVLTPENVDKLLSIFSEIEKGAKDGKDKKTIGKSSYKAITDFVSASNIQDETDALKLLDYAANDSKYTEKIMQLQTDKMTDKVFSIFNVVLERSMTDYVKTRQYGQLDKKGVPVDPVQRAIYKESQPFAKQVVDELYEGSTKVKAALFGKGEKKDKEAFNSAMSDVTKNISKYAPEAIGAGLLGAGASLITGMVGGPLLGAAVGAGISITKNSDKVQNWLFGEMKDGERQGGVIPKKYINKISKLLPDLKTYGIAGGLTGLLPLVPFGPIGGLMLGSGIAFAKNNERVQDALFGESGLFKPEFREQLKKKLPRIAGGAAIGLFAGPFGILGNALLGSGIGILSTTDRFNKVMFGELDPNTGEYEHGILPMLRHTVVDPMKSFLHVTGTKLMDFINDKIMEPLKEAFEPIKKDVQLLLKGMFEGIGNFINNMFEKSFGIPLSKFLEEKLINPFKKVFGGLFKAFMFLPKKLISTPFALLGAYGRSRRKAHIRKGNADYMTAEERVNFRKTNKVGGLFKRDRFAELDQLLMDANPEDVDEMYNDLDLLSSNKTKLADDKQSAIEKMGFEISKYLNYDDSKKAMQKLTESGDMDAVKKLIKSQYKDNTRKNNRREDLINELSSAWKDENISPDDRARMLKDKQKEIFQLFNYDDGRNIEKLIKAGKFDEASKIAKKLKDTDKNKTTDLFTFMDENFAKFQEITKIQSSSDDVRQQLFKDLSKKYGIKITDDNIGKYLNLIKQEKGIRDDKKLVLSENENTETVSQSDILEQDKEQHQEIVDLFKEAISKLNEIIHPKEQPVQDAAEMVKPKRFTLRRKKSRTIETPKDFIDSSREEDEAIKESGADPDKVSKHFLGGFIKKTQVSAVSAGEYIHNAENVEAVMDAVPNLLKKEGEKTSILDRILNVVQNIFKINKDEHDNPTRIDDQGNVMEFIKDGRGELKPNLGDSSTRSAINNAKEKQENEKGFFGKLHDSIGNLLSKLNPFSDKKKDNDKSFIDIIMDKFKTIAGIGAMITAAPAIIEFISPVVKKLWDENIHPWVSTKFIPWLETTGIPKLAEMFIRGIGSFITVTVPNIVDRVANMLGLSGEKGEKSLLEHTGGIIVRDTFRGGKLMRGVSSIMSVGDTASDVAKHAAKRGVKSTVSKGIISKGASFIDKVGDTLVRKPLQFIDKATGLNRISKSASEKVGDYILDKGIKLSGFVKNISAKNVVAEGAEAAVKGGVIGKFASKISKGLKALFNNGIVKKLTGGKGIPVDAISKPLIEWIERNAVKVAAKISGRLAAMLSSAGIINILIGVGDFVSGYKNVRSILGITGEPTLGMRLAAATIKAVNGFLLFGVIPEHILVNLLFPVFTKIFGGGEKLTKMREEAVQEVADYNEKNGTNLSIEQYNKTMGKEKSLLTTIKQGIGKGVTAVGNFLKPVTNKIKEVGGAVWNKAKEVGGKVWNKAKEIGGKVWNKTKEFAGVAWDKAKEFGSNAWETTKEVAVKVKDTVAKAVAPIIASVKDVGGFIFRVSKSIFKSALGSQTNEDLEGEKIDPNDPLADLKTVAKAATQVITLPIYMVLKLGKFVFDKIVKPVWEGIKDVGVFLFSTLKQGAKDAWNLDIKAYFTAPPIDASNPVAPLKSALFLITRIVGAPVYGAIALFRMIQGNTDSIWSGLVDIGKFLGGMIGNSIKSGWNLDIASFFTKPADTDGGPLSPLKNVLFYVSKVLTAPIFLATAAIRGVYEAIDPIWSVLKDIGSDTLSGLKDAWNLDIVSFFTKPQNEDGSNMGTLRSILFYTNRVLLSPVYLGVAALRVAFEAIEPIWNTLTAIGSDFISGLADAWNLDIKGFFTPPTEKDGSDVGLLRKILFYTNRYMLSPIYLGMAALRVTYEVVKPVFDNFLEIAGFIFDGMKDAWSLDIRSFFTIPPVDEQGNPMGTLKTILFATSRSLLSPIYLGIAAFRVVYDIIKPVMHTFLDIAGFIGKTLTSGIRDAWNLNIKSFFTMPEGEVEEGGGVLKAIIFYSNRILAFPVYAAIAAIKPVMSAIKFVWDTAVEVGGFIIDTLATGVMDAWNLDIKSFFASPVTEEDGMGMGTLKNAIFYSNRILALPVYAAISIVGLVVRNIKTIWDTAVDVGSFMVKNAATGLRDAWKLNIKSFFTAPKGKDGEGLGVLKTILFYTDRILKAPIYLAVAAVSAAVKAVKFIWDTAVDVGSFMIQITGSGIRDAWNLDIKSYFTTSTAQNGEGLGGLKTVLFYTDRILKAPIYAAVAVVSGVVKGIKTIWDDVVDFAGYLGEVVGDGLSAAWNLDIKAYFTLPDNTSGGLGGALKTGVFYINRILGAPVYIAVAAVSAVVKGIGAIWDSISDVWSFFKDIQKELSSDKYDKSLDGYWTKPSNMGSGFSAGVKTVLFYMHRILSFPGSLVKILVNHIADTFQPIIDWVGKTAKWLKEKLDDAANFLTFGLYETDSEKEEKEKADTESPRKKEEIRKKLKAKGRPDSIIEALLQVSDLDTLYNTVVVEDAGGPKNKVSKHRYTKRFGMGGPIDVEGNRYFVERQSKSTTNNKSVPTSYSDVQGVVQTNQPLNASNIPYHNLTYFNPVTAQQLNEFMKSYRKEASPFHGNGDTFIKAANQTGLDPRYILAHAALESGWGTSKISQDKNNYFGIAAYNKDPYFSAKTFSNGFDNSIIEGAKWIRKNYTDRGQNSLYSMIYGDPKHRYAVYDNGQPNDGWVKNIASIMSKQPNLGNLVQASVNAANMMPGAGMDLSGMPGITLPAVNEDQGLFGMISEFSSMFQQSFDKLLGLDTESVVTGESSLLKSLNVAKPAEKWFTGTLKDAMVTSGYGLRKDPTGETSDVENHKGIDVAAAKGTAIRTPINGIVEYVGFDQNGYGHYLRIRDKMGNSHIFGHMNERPKVVVGQNVKTGDVIGYIGSTGRSTGPHLHYQVDNAGTAEKGDTFNPNDYLNDYLKKYPTGGPKEKVDPKQVKIQLQRPEEVQSRSRIKSAGGESSNDNNKMIKLIVEVLLRIADNTSNLSQIVKLLTDVLGVKVSEESVKKVKSGIMDKGQLLSSLQNSTRNSKTLDNETLLRTLEALASE